MSPRKKPFEVKDVVEDSTINTISKKSISSKKIFKKFEKLLKKILKAGIINEKDDENDARKSIDKEKNN